MKVNFKRKKRYSGIFFGFLCFTIIGFVLMVEPNVLADDAQPVELVWEKSGYTFSDVTNLKKASNGYLITGWVTSSSRTMARINKVDSEGNSEWGWGTAAGGSYENMRESRFEDAVDLGNGSYIAVGRVVSTENSDATYGLVSKFEEVDGEMKESGYFVFDKDHGVWGTRINSVLVDSDGGVIMSGYYTNSSPRKSVVFVMKIKSSFDCTIARADGTVCDEDLVWYQEIGHTSGTVDNTSSNTKIKKGMGDREFFVLTGYYKSSNTSGGRPLIVKIKESESLDSVEIISSHFDIGWNEYYEDFVTFDGKTFVLAQTNSVKKSILRENLTETSSYFDSESKQLVAESSDKEVLTFLMRVVDGTAWYSLKKADEKGNERWRTPQTITLANNIVAVTANDDGSIIALGMSGNNVKLYKLQDNTTYYHVNYHLVDKENMPDNLVLYRDSALSGEQFMFTDYDNYSGYKLDGWYTDPELTTKFTDYDAPANGEIDLYGRYDVTHTVWYNISNANVCGEYQSSMLPGSSETVAHGGLVSMKKISPDGQCVITNLRSQVSGGSTLNEFSVDMPVMSDMHLYGTYAKNRVIIQDDEVYFANGELVEEIEGLSYDNNSRILTLNNYNYIGIEVDNGTEPVTVVLEGDNTATISSTGTPIIVSGDGSLENESDYVINMPRASLTVENGKINGVYGKGILADSLVVGEEGVENAIEINSPIQLGSYSQKSSGGFVLNGGTVNSNGYSAIYGNNMIVRGGSFSTNYGLDVKSGDLIDADLIIDGGEVVSGGGEGITAGRIVVLDGRLQGMQVQTKKSFVMNGGETEVMMPMIEGTFVLNGGEFVGSMGLNVRNGYMIFNGGKADLKMVSVSYPGTLESEMEAEIDYLNNNFDAGIDKTLLGSGVIFNGGDTTIRMMTIEDVVESYLGQYVSIIEGMARNSVSEEQEQYGTEEEWAEGVCSTMNDEGGLNFRLLKFPELFEAFSGMEDCKGRIGDIYLSLVEEEIRDGLRQEMMNSMGAEPMPPYAARIMKNNNEVEGLESAIYINREKLISDPKNTEGVVVDQGTMFDDEIETFATFGNQGDLEGNIQLNLTGDPETEEMWYAVFNNSVEGDLVGEDASKYVFGTVHIYEHKQDIAYHWQNDKDEYEANSDDTELKLIIDVDFDHFDHKVEVDGKEIIAGTDYEAVSGSTEITLKKDYLNSLATGEHEIKVYFANMSQYNDTQVSTTFTIKKKANPEPVDPDDDKDDNKKDEEKDDNTANIPDTSGGTEEKTGDHGIMNREQSFVAVSLAGTMIIAGIVSLGINRKRQKR